jgi:hypothetical protein
MVCLLVIGGTQAEMVTRLDQYLEALASPQPAIGTMGKNPQGVK